MSFLIYFSVEGPRGVQSGAGRQSPWWSRDKSELLWSYQWMSERAAKLKLRLSVLGLDLSRAFDTPRRAKLLSLLEGVLDPDCCRLARVLLSKSSVSVRVGRYVGAPFETNLGVPQGGLCVSCSFSVL